LICSKEGIIPEKGGDRRTRKRMSYRGDVVMRGDDTTHGRECLERWHWGKNEAVS